MGLEPIVWITEKTALLAVAVPTIWHYVGFYFVILITAINRIPLDLYESAYLDGITGVSKTIYITIPVDMGYYKSLSGIGYNRNPKRYLIFHMSLLREDLWSIRIFGYLYEYKRLLRIKFSVMEQLLR